MSIIGCGLILSGLLAGGILGCIVPAFVTMGIGALFLIGATLEERQKEKRAQAWRASYPSYKY